MPLINLQTNLKSLRFEGQAPYITKYIDGPIDNRTYENQINVRADDVLRLSRMFLDAPGAKFLAHQAALIASDPKTYQSTRTSMAGRIAAAVSKVGVGTARAAGTTLAQAAVNGTGLHFILPRPDYYYTDDNGAGSQSVFSQTVVRDRDTSTIYSSRTSRYGDLTAPPVPGYRGLTGANLSEEPLNVIKQDYIVGPASDLRDSPGNPITNAGIEALGGSSITVTNYRSSQTGKVEETLDNLYAFGGTQKRDTAGLLDVGQGDASDDLVPVIFSKFSSAGTYTGTKVFRGFIGNISDSYQANWSPQSYVGRMEQFFIYTGFTRSLTFPFTIPIFSRDEQLPILNKINSLVSHTAPQYLNGNGVPSGIITYLKIGDYIQTPGVLNSVGVTVSNDVPWSYGNKMGTKEVLLPQVYQLQIQFTPIHESTPEFDITTIDQKRASAGKFRYIANIENFS